MATGRDRRFLATVPLLLITALLCAAAGARTIYVDNDAPDFGDGSSWETAYRHLQDALAEAEAAEGPTEIRVAQGLYRPDRSAAHPDGTGDREATFQLISGLTLRGGYAGVAEVDPDAHDVALYETALSGDLAGDDVEVNEPVDLVNATLGNSHTVVTGTGTDHTAVLDGFTITRGHSYTPVPRGVGSHAGSGAGMNNCPGSPTVRNCTFSHNVTDWVGAGIYSEDCRPTVVNCRFIMNFAIGGGGAMANIDGCEAHVKTCSFESNGARVSGGGAIYNRPSRPTIEGCDFFDNTTGRRMRSLGGAIVNRESVSVLADCSFARNTSELGGAIFSDEGSSLDFSRCVFLRNSATSSGGAILSVEGHCAFENCLFYGNSAKQGGAVDILSASFRNCVFAGNCAHERGVGGEHWMPGLGGAVSTIGPLGAVFFASCTFDNNRAGLGAAIFSVSDRARVDDCVLRGPGEQIHDQSAARRIPVRFSALPGGWPGEGNIDADPLFANPGHWDPNGTPDDPNDDFWVDGDYHLKSQAGRWDPATEAWVIDDVTSPCIDAGDPNSPVGHEPFPNGGRINIGAYGGTAEGSKSWFGEPPCETITAGDINGDCRVDFKDFQTLSLHWLESGDKAQE